MSENASCTSDTGSSSATASAKTSPSTRSGYPAVWAWAVPLVGALGVFAFVLATTPPGFVSIVYVFVGGARGVAADAAAYALGAAAGLALIALVLLAALLGGLDLLLRRRRRSSPRHDPKGGLAPFM